MARNAPRDDMMARTSISLPRTLKRQMESSGINWSAYLREAISQRLDREAQQNLAEAVLLNERVRRKAPKGWDSAKVVREWRDRRR